MSSTVGVSRSTSFLTVMRGEYVSSAMEEADEELEDEDDEEDEDAAEKELADKETVEMGKPRGGDKGGGSGAALGSRSAERGGPPNIDWTTGRR